MANYSMERFRVAHANLTRLVAWCFKRKTFVNSDAFDSLTELEDMIGNYISGLYFHRKRCLLDRENGLYKVQIIWSIGADRNQYDTSAWFTEAGDFVRRNDFCLYEEPSAETPEEVTKTGEENFEEVDYDPEVEEQQQ